jgi:AcrR family transcriptional regulator
MSVRQAVVRLGEADLRHQRHVCALFDGPEDAAKVLVPFVVQGLQQGDRVVHVVKDAKAYVQPLGKRSAFFAALESGQLDVRTWDASYLSGGRFSAPRMLTYIRRLLREGPTLGFAGIRLIGDMQWADDGIAGVEDLVAYESGVDALVARPRTVVVCAYDVRHHPARRITQILEAHQAALQGGRLLPTSRSGGTTRPRDRILTAAAVLFGENGTGRTGVDTLIEAAGVAKATFYRHFPTKDALIVAWLQDPRARWFDRVRAQAHARAATPAEVIPRFFEAVTEWLEADDFIGCPYLNTTLEISDPNHPASRQIGEYLAEIGRYLEEQVAAAGHPDSARLGRELHVLLAGSISLGVANRSTTHVRAARDAALRLLNAPLPG